MEPGICILDTNCAQLNCLGECVTIIPKQNFDLFVDADSIVQLSILEIIGNENFKLLEQLSHMLSNEMKKITNIHCTMYIVN